MEVYGRQGKPLSAGCFPPFTFLLKRPIMNLHGCAGRVRVFLLAKDCAWEDRI